MRLNRRAFALGLSSSAATLTLASRLHAEQVDTNWLHGPSNRNWSGQRAMPLGKQHKLDPELARRYAALYGPVPGEPFPVPAINLTQVDPAFLRSEVDYHGTEAPGTIVVDPHARYLYFVLPGGRAMRYGVGVGRAGFGWSGVATINSKQEWPDWYPPREMIERDPEIEAQLTDLQSGRGVAGGPDNPLGCRALYLWQNNKDTLYRIHGTFEPWTIGTNVSSGCIRMINQDAIDLYERTPVGTTVLVLA